METVYAVIAICCGIAVFCAVCNFLSRPKDETWIQDLLSDVRNLKDEAIMIRISAEDLAALNAGQQVIMEGPVIVTPPLPVHFVYTNGMFGWLGGWDFGIAADYEDTVGAPVPGPKDIAIKVVEPFGGWLPHAPGGAFDTTAYKDFVVSLKFTTGNEELAFYVESAHDTKDGTGVDLLKYAVSPVEVGRWVQYKVPLADLNLTDPVILKFCIQDKTGLTGQTYFIDQVGFAP